MTGNTGLDVRDRHVPGRPPRKRNWWRWILAGVLVLAVLVVLAGVLALRFWASAPPLVLPGGSAAAPAGPVDGTWAAGAGSVAGFRVRETALGISGGVTGQTGAVTGTTVISGGQVTRAVFRIDLTSITVAGKTQPQFTQSLDTTQYPSATITLARPVTLPAAFTSGATITVTAPGSLTLRGMTRLVTVTISARRDGTALQAAGSIPITLSRWGITKPASYGMVGSLASHGTAEFLLVLHRDTGAGRGAGTAG
jgi:polyisoprenoid-binding protein YceI